MTSITRAREGAAAILAMDGTDEERRDRLAVWAVGMANDAAAAELRRVHGLLEGFRTSLDRGDFLAVFGEAAPPERLAAALGCGGPIP